MKNKTLSLIFGVIIVFSLSFATASLNVQLSDQGTGVAYSNGTTLSSANLAVLVYDASSGGNLVYNETFSNAILNGSWNVMLGSGVNLPLEFGKVYYKDYLIAGESASFDGSDRQAFYSPLGDINGSDLTSDFYVNTVGNINTTGNVSIGGLIDFGENNTLSANSTSIFYFNGTSWIDLTQGNGGNTTNYWSRNATSNITSLANLQDNVELANNFTTTGTGFFSWLGSLTNKVTNIFTNDLVVNNTIEFRDENHALSANDTAIYYFNGSDYIDLTQEGNSSVFIGANVTVNGTSGLVPQPLTNNEAQCLLGNGSWGNCGGISPWQRNSTTNITSLANTQDSVRIENNLKVTGDLNMTSNNVTYVDCIIFISGGKICNSA